VTGPARRRSDQVRRALLTRIVSGEIPPGTLLPREDDLAEEFSVSRIVVREAVKYLEASLLVSIRQGVGTTVLPRESWSLLDPDVLSTAIEFSTDQALFFELSKLRITIEGELAASAATMADRDHLASMKAVLERSRRVMDNPDRFLEEDLAFHNLIADAASSPIARAVLRLLSEPLRTSRRLTNRIPGGVEHAQAAHEAIYSAIVARSPERALSEMVQHLTWSRHHLVSAE